MTTLILSAAVTALCGAACIYCDRRGRMNDVLWQRAGAFGTLFAFGCFVTGIIAIPTLWC